MGWGGSRGRKNTGIWCDPKEGGGSLVQQMGFLDPGGLLNPGLRWPRNARFTRQRARRSTSERITASPPRLGRGRTAFPLTCGPSRSILFFCEASVQRCPGRLASTLAARAGRV